MNSSWLWRHYATKPFPTCYAEHFGTLATLYPDGIDLGFVRAPGAGQLTAQALNRDQRAVYEFPVIVQDLMLYISLNIRTAPVSAIPGEGKIFYLDIGI